jgi:hypothetical protein
VQNEDQHPIRFINGTGPQPQPISPAEMRLRLSVERAADAARAKAAQEQVIASNPSRPPRTWRDMETVSGVGPTEELIPMVKAVAADLDAALKAEETVRLSAIADALGSPDMSLGDVQKSLARAVQGGELTEAAAQAIYWAVTRSTR